MLNEEKVRMLVHAERISGLRPIPDADRIEVARVLGWDVVVKKGEFKVGDLCAYFEIDSILPFAPWSEFLRNKEKPDKPIRLRTVKMRGQISQGLAVPLREVLAAAANDDFKPDEFEGMDLTETLGVTKYEPPIPAELAGKVLGVRPHFVPKTDEERLQNIPGIIKEVAGVRLYTTVKLNGTSASYFFYDVPQRAPKPPFGVCSRNLELVEEEKNTYWRMAVKYNLREKLQQAGSFAVQGEVCGPGIQKNMLGLKEHDLFIFNVYDIMGSRFLNYDEFIEFCKRWELQTVPVEDDNVVLTGNETVEELLLRADGVYHGGHLREGLVWRPVIEMTSPTLDNGRLSFKTVSNKYLMKGGE